ncbi:hypothetical protein GR702_04070 [Novosphingobium sp. FGD1]|uniref:Uncharacterized protein n=1 Tax=Novosphingobium silvae TaxID=2692619 RepID=A0A7X4K5H5_9SPHN|nr:hypothetical protein [Novosphingobium silvae]MYL96951.1 hypothetical protein [Novosphingobium silvae]
MFEDFLELLNSRQPTPAARERLPGREETRIAETTSAARDPKIARGA